MINLKTKLLDLLLVIPPGSEIVYLDYPVYSNIGDLLIFEGAERFFSDNDINIVDRFSLKEASALSRRRVGERVIVLQGGGNFGDLYPWHQAFREHVVRSFPDNRIVILPQTIHFSNEREAKRAGKVFRAHRDLYIFVRDERSQALASTELSHNRANVRLMPDMAHWLYGHIRPSVVAENAARGTLWLMRGDKERLGESTSLEGYHPEYDFIGDWKDIRSPSSVLMEHVMAKYHRAAGVMPFRPFKPWKTYIPFVRSQIDASVDFFSKFERITTSRLHGHILGALLDKQITLYDNSYGKNRGYYDCWTKSVRNVTFAE